MSFYARLRGRDYYGLCQKVLADNHHAQTQAWFLWKWHLILEIKMFEWNCPIYECWLQTVFKHNASQINHICRLNSTHEYIICELLLPPLLESRTHFHLPYSFYKYLLGWSGQGQLLWRDDISDEPWVAGKNQTSRNLENGCISFLWLL